MSGTNGDDLELLTTQQLPELLGLSVRTVKTWRLVGGGPRFGRVNRNTVRYRRGEVARWITERERANTSDDGRASGAGAGASDATGIRTA